jgi:double zinc ribbon protein
MEVHRPMQDDERDPGEAPADQPAGQAPSEAEAWVVPPPLAPSNPDVISAHAVPATPLSEGTVCPRCGTENRPGIAFCRNCGQRLMAPGAPAAVERPSPPEGTQACPRCGTHNRAGVPFCQNCGANLRPADAEVASAPTPTPAREAPRRAVLGPVVLLIGAAGMLTGWLLPFAFGGSSLWDRSYGVPGGYGIGFWQGYPDGPIVDTAYFGLAAPVPILVALLVVLAIAGVVRAAPGRLQRIGLLVALVWALGLVALFLVVELIAGPGGDLIGVLRALSPGGIIFLLAGLIVAIGTLTRLWRA